MRMNFQNRNEIEKILEWISIKPKWIFKKSERISNDPFSEKNEDLIYIPVTNVKERNGALVGIQRTVFYVD
jgi:hypothetical protein